MRQGADEEGFFVILLELLRKRCDGISQSVRLRRRQEPLLLRLETTRPVGREQSIRQQV